MADCRTCEGLGWFLEPCPECGKIKLCNVCHTVLEPLECENCKGEGVIPAPAGEEPEGCMDCLGYGEVGFCPHCAEE